MADTRIADPAGATTTAPVATPETTHADEEAHPKGVWQKLDVFLWGRGQEILGGFLILALLFWSVIGGISIHKMTKLEKKNDILANELKTAQTQIATWGENTGKAITALEATNKTLTDITGQQTTILTAQAENLAATVSTQEGVKDLAKGVEGLYTANEETMTALDVGLSELVEKVDKIRCTVTINKTEFKEREPVPAPPAPEVVEQPVAVPEKITATVTAPVKKRWYWLWLR